MNNPPLRWGILSAAQIARKNWLAILNTGNSVVTAVASRDLDRSRSFIAECQAAQPMPSAPEACASYEALLASPNVDAVYIPLPTGVRKAWVIRAAQAGKHILCEKPCSVSLADLEEMLAACRRHKVQYMDGTMFSHSGRLAAIRKVLDDGASIGPIRRIVTSFTFRGSDEFLKSDIRTDGALEPHGCLGDLGWYCIRFTLWALNWRMPRSVSGRIHAPSRPGPRGVPLDFSGELMFDGGVSAGFTCSFTTSMQQWAVIGGSHGHLRMDDFVVPFYGPELGFEVASGRSRAEKCVDMVEANARRVTVGEWSSGHPTAQEASMFRDFAELVLSGKRSDFWPDISLKTQAVVNACHDAALAAMGTAPPMARRRR